jgi:hypothetical protein
VTANYHDVVKVLCRLSLEFDVHGRQVPNTLILSSDAIDTLHEAMAELEPKLGPGGAFEHYRDWAGKLIGAEVRIAALLHMVENVRHWQPWAVPITAETMRAALIIGNYLAEHASAAYTLMGTDTDASEAEHVWKWIARRGEPVFTKRDAYQVMKGRFGKAEKLDAPLGELVRRNMIRVKPTAEEPRAGRPPSPSFEVNPSAMAAEQPTRHEPPARGNCEDIGGAFPHAGIVGK